MIDKKVGESKVKMIKKWHDICRVLLIGFTIITILLIGTHSWEWIIIFCFADIVMIIILQRRKRLFHDASLIFNNQILFVPLAFIGEENCNNQKILNEIVVSTFGLLIGSKVYKWGCDGLTGVRLKRIEIDKERMWLSFGTEEEIQCIELLHGITNEQTLIETAQKLRHETGVTAKIAGYEWTQV